MRPRVQVFDDPLLIVNLSVWESIEALEAFAYREAAHLAVLRRRREWFERHIEAADRPLVGRSRAHSDARRGARPAGDATRARGPSPQAFTFRERFRRLVKVTAHSTQGVARGVTSLADLQRPSRANPGRRT